MIDKLKYIYHQIFLNKLEYSFIKKKSSDYNKELPYKNVLFQMPEEYYYVIAFNSVISSLKKQNRLKINWIDYYTHYQVIGLSSFIKNLSFYGRKWRKLYLFNGGKIVLNFFISLPQYLFYFKQGYEIFKNLKSKEDVLNIKFDDTLVGDLIYDTYLRYAVKPTINYKDKFLLKIIISSIHIYNKSKTYLQSNEIDIFFTSYAAYSHHGIIVRIALKQNIKVVTISSHEKLFNEITAKFPYHVVDFTNYKSDLIHIKKSFRKKYVKEAKYLLHNRLNGKASLSYMKKSTFMDYNSDLTFFGKKNKPRIVIFIHDFFDSPHVRGWMFFEDYYEWLRFILVSADTEMNDYFIKIHPNSSEANIRVVNKLLQEFKKIKLIFKDISTKQLVGEGIDLVITHHGTVAHELPLLGVPVLCSGNNPHISFSFSYTAKTKEEFRNLLRKPNIVPRLHNQTDIENEIYDYYFIHYLYNKKSTLTENNTTFLNYLRNISSIEDFNSFVLEKDSLEFKKQLKQVFNIDSI